MISDALLAQFRLDVDDTERPYLWSDTEVYSYLDSGQKQFCRKVEGIGDASSTLTSLSVGVGTEWISISPLILKFRDAYKISDGRPIRIVNYEDLQREHIRFDGNQAPFRMMIIGMEPGRVRLHPIASVADTIQLLVDRLPLKSITDDGQTLEIQDHHTDGMLYWMKYKAYAKQDAETMDKKASEDYKAKFEEYCAQAKIEKDRAKHKTRVVKMEGSFGRHTNRRDYFNGY